MVCSLYGTRYDFKVDFKVSRKQVKHDRYEFKGVQWLGGRVLDSRPKGRGFKPHRRHCVVSLSKNINPSIVLV